MDLRSLLGGKRSEQRGMRVRAPALQELCGDQAASLTIVKGI
jgi:hypothetical protein